MFQKTIFKATHLDFYFNLIPYQAWSRLKIGSISKSKFIELKFFWKFWNRYLSNQNNIKNIKNFNTKTIKSKNYDLIFFGTKFNQWYSDNYQFVLIFSHNIDLLHLNIRHIKMIPVLVAFKKTTSIFHSQYQNDTDSQQFRKILGVFSIPNIEIIPIK